MDSLGGGGQMSGGSVVQSTSPWAATAAGAIGANAANQASEYMSEAINKAMGSINQNYQQSRQEQRPYTQAGVAALNQLNQYLGMGAYNPGNAPTKPTAVKTTQPEIMRYVNSQLNPVTGQYSGVGADSIFRKEGYRDPNTGEALGNNVLTSDNTELVQKQVQDYLNKQNQTLNDTAMAGYNQDLIDYNTNKASYDKFTAEGPLSSAQVQDRITNLPGYQAELGQGVNAIGTSASARGYLGSGRALKELMNFGQNTLSTYYGNELSRLAGVAGMGQQSAGVNSNTSNQQGSSLAALQQSLGETRANAALAGGNALSNAMIGANQNYEVMGQSSSGGGFGGLGSLLGGIGSLKTAFGPAAAASSIKFKDKTSTPSTAEILENVNQMSLDKWKYKGIDVEHIGPYAEQFQELFGVGDGKSINMVDAIGVLLGAVKELSMKVNKLEGKSCL